MKKLLTKTRFVVVGLAVAWLTLPGVRPQAQADTGTWVPLINPAPDNLAHLLPLSDGTVLATQGGPAIGSNWFRLTPDSGGRYFNGTWTNIAPMHYTRVFFSSTVLKDGRVFVAGGQSGTGSATAEIYNPLSNTWTVVSPPASVLDPTQTSPGWGAHLQSIGNAECKVLPNGQVLICPYYPKISKGTLLYDPVANSWTSGPPTLNLVVEASAMKLADGSILTVDSDKSSSERYLPALNLWTNDASTSPAYLWASLYPFYGFQGPAFLLPDGRAIFFGGNGQTALYTLSPTNGPGIWVPGPNIPTNLGAANTAGAMMPNGKILLAVSPPPYVTNSTLAFPGPLSFYEYDYSVGTTGAFMQAAFPYTVNVGSYATMMLDLPDGAVLFGLSGNSNLFHYRPFGSPLAAGKPVISTITTNGDGSYHLTGRLFNGISEGAAFGNDHQMDSNFPLVRFIDSAGHVRYGRTYNWSSTGVMTGNALVSTECMPPAGASITDTIQVVANGIASDGVTLLVTTSDDSGPGSLRQVAGVLQGGGTVTFAADLSGQTITLTSGEIAITNNLTIDASALPNGIIIDGNHSSRIFKIGGGTVTLNTLVLTNGYTTNGNWGGAILNAGTLALNYCTLAGNSGDSTVAGGAIANVGSLTALGCTFSGNSAAFSGAIDNRSTCTLQNSTFFGNVAFGGNGGAIDNSSATLSVLQCTFSGNSANSFGGAIDNYLSQVNITNTIAVGDTAANTGYDIYNWGGSTINAGGANIIPALANGGTLVGGATISSANPLLGPLTNNGGPTLTMMLQPGSPAIEAGNNAAANGLSFDQRGPGFPRIVGSAVDIGAYESAFTSTIACPGDISTNTANGTDLVRVSYSPPMATGSPLPVVVACTPPSGSLFPVGTTLVTCTASNAAHVATCSFTVKVCATNITTTTSADSGPGSLRQALLNVCPNGRIDFTNTLSGQTILLTSGQLSITSPLSILGPGPTNVIIGGNAASRVFYIAPNLNITIAGLTLADGASPFGGAIYNDHSILMLSNCTLSGNVASGGGGIYNDGNSGNATLSLSACTFSRNSAVSSGGGIYNDGEMGGNTTLNLLNSTFSTNLAQLGGGVYNDGFYGSAALSVNASTFNGNSTTVLPDPGGGGIYCEDGNGIATVQIGDTILSAGALGGTLQGGTVTSLGYNLSSDNGGGFLTETTDQINTDPELGPLQNNGGPTFTHAPLAGSPAIDKGKRDAIPSLAANTDQRGFARPIDFSSIPNASDGDGSDIGAFEAQLAAAAGTPMLLVGPQKLLNGSFQFSFTNTPGASLTVLTTTNIALPLSNWTVLGTPTEISPGNFQYSDPQATNQSRRFYGVRSP